MSAFIPSNLQTDHFTSHSALLPVYEKLFDPIKDTTNSILEIGVNDGGGIKMYSDYFQHAKAFGIDILPLPVGLGGANPRYIQGDAYTAESVELMKKLGGDFALIVDDGSHTLEHQVWFCKNYPALLAPDGLAIVEDIQDSDYLYEINKSIPAGFNRMVIDLSVLSGRYDDLIFVIWPKI